MAKPPRTNRLTEPPPSPTTGRARPSPRPNGMLPNGAPALVGTQAISGTTVPDSIPAGIPAGISDGPRPDAPAVNGPAGAAAIIAAAAPR